MLTRTLPLSGGFWGQLGATFGTVGAKNVGAPCCVFVGGGTQFWKILWRAYFGARILDPPTVFLKFRGFRAGFLLQIHPKSLRKNRSDLFKAPHAPGPAQPSKTTFFGPIFNFAPPCWFFAMRRPFRNSAPFWGQNWGVFVPQKVNTEGQSCCRLD